MSTHIVDKIEAIRLPKELTGHWDDVYIVMELGGDNNVRNNKGRRARDWSVMFIGSEWQVIGECCRFAAHCSGGMTKLKGRETKPEAYIRAYRKALTNAADGLQGAGERGIGVSARIRFARNKNAAYHLAQAVKGGKTPREVTRYDETFDEIAFDLNNQADLKLWLDCRHGAGWNNAEVYGPGTV